MAAHLLELRGVTHEYGAGNRRFTAIEGVSLAVDEGEFVALLGPSGSGKSTLLRIITGLIRPTQGQVLYRGAPLAGVNPVDEGLPDVRPVSVAGPCSKMSRRR